jgi:hypothetical protein
MMSFIDDVADERERNSPVRAAVKAHAADINTARDAGQPLNAIYCALRRKGHHVGKGYSSFRAAVRYLDQHGWPKGSAPALPAVATPMPASVAADTGPLQGLRGRFADERNPSEF